LEKTGLVGSITDAVVAIAQGRLGLATKGDTEEGLEFYQKGLAIAMRVFKEALEGGDPETIILVDEAFVVQEQAFCNPHDVAATGSLKAAAVGHNEALRVLPTVKDAAAYQAAETTYPQDPHYRYKGMPKDSFHVACTGHASRLGNTLKTPGMNMLEKAVYRQRQVNMIAVKGVYLALQKAALYA
jgi:hypothetical protein